MKERADVLVYEKGLAPSREKAKTLIMAGEVFIGTDRVQKAGQMLSLDADLKVKGRSLKYVSRGGFKLEKILEDNKIDLSNKVCMDIGASTGGFTDCMLQHGAEKVYAVDVGYNQLDYKMRMDPRVVVMERTNIRSLDPSLIEDPIGFISIDVSFISLELVLPLAVDLLDREGKICALIKPQFEAGKDKVGKGGIVRDPKVHREVLENMVALVEREGLFFSNLTFSPIKGTTGNIEFLMLLETQDTGFVLNGYIDHLLEMTRREFKDATESTN